MNRIEKIKLLRSINDGIITAEAIQDPVTYFVDEAAGDPAKYRCKGKEYDQRSFEEFKSKVQRQNSKNIVWVEQKSY